MKPKWLIENYNKDTSTASLIAEIKRQGMEVCEVNYEPFESGEYDVYDSNDCVIVMGSINLVKQLQRTKTWVPNGWCNWNALKCTSYYPYLGQFLLNDEYIMLPVCELKRKKNLIFNHIWGTIDSVFVRPNSGAKCFCGQVISSKNFDKDIDLMIAYSEPDEIAILGPKYSIDREYRLVVSQKQVIAYSQYRCNGELNITRGLSPKTIASLLEYAKRIIDSYDPDPIYTMDIAKCDESLYLIELNSFACSGLYDCNMEAIVNVASELALEEWKFNNELSIHPEPL